MVAAAQSGRNEAERRAAELEQELQASREAQEAAKDTKLKIVHATADLAQELAKTDRNNPPGELASQGIYKNAEDPDAAPKPKAAKKKRAPDDGAAGKKAAKK